MDVLSKQDIKVLKELIRHIEVYLPETWQTEKWFMEAKNVVDKLTKAK